MVKNDSADGTEVPTTSAAHVSRRLWGSADAKLPVLVASPLQAKVRGRDTPRVMPKLCSGWEWVGFYGDFVVNIGELLTHLCTFHFI